MVEPPRKTRAHGVRGRGSCPVGTAPAKTGFMFETTDLSESVLWGTFGSSLSSGANYVPAAAPENVAVELSVVSSSLAATSTSSWPVGRPPITIGRYVESVKAYSLPVTLEPHLPCGQGRPAPSWSAFEAAIDQQHTWSETGLRGRIKEALLAQQREPACIAPLKPRSDDPEGLTHQYIEVN